MSIFKPIFNGVMGNTFNPIAGVDAWSPLSLSGLVWWNDIYDMSTMYQDIAGTTPVTASGDPVGRIIDASGNAYVFVASLDARRPTWNTDGTYCWLDFDGTDDCLFSNAAIDMTATNDVSICMGVTGDVNTFGVIAELSTNNNTNNGSWGLYRGATSQCYTMSARGTVAPTAAKVAVSTTHAAVTTDTVIGIAPIDAVNRIIVEGAETVATDANKGTGNYGTYVMYLGARGNASDRFNGKVYTSFGTNTIMTAGEITQVRAYIDARRP